MFNRKLIIGVIAVFLIIATFPFWFGKGKAVTRPDLDLDTPEIRALAERLCIEDTPYMRANHMKLLKAWRDDVVRNGNRVYTTKDGRKFEMSLTGSCLKCHDNKDKFCDRCHNYVGANPSCWNCHVVPGELREVKK
jgi:hypothetical protein